MKLNFLHSACAILSYISSVAAQQRIPPTGSTFLIPDKNGTNNKTFTIAETTWVLEAAPHIPRHNFTGTAQQAYVYVSKNYPAYKWPGLPAGNSTTTAAAAPNTTATTPHANALNATLLNTAAGVQEARANGDPAAGTVQCWRFAACEQSSALNSIDYLAGVPGAPVNAPNTCARISCGYDCGVWWCNDNEYSLTLPNFNWIADYANAIDTGCSASGGFVGMTYGQNFHPSEGWNVILGKPANSC